MSGMLDSQKRLTIFVPSMCGGGAERTMLNLAQAIETTLAGKTLHPPRESWRPFELEVVVSQYTNTLLGSSLCVLSRFGYR
jgi:hypothetical protein